MIKDYLKLQNAVISILTGFALGTICRLGVLHGIIIGVVVFFFLPPFAHCIRKERALYKKYTEADLYMEQMESSFKKNRKIYDSLKETLSLFPSGEMEECLQKAVYEIDKPSAMADSSEKALQIIEQEYGCEQMELMHSFFLRSEEQGGDCTRAVKVLRHRRNSWSDAVEECRSKKKNILVSVLISLVLLFTASECLVLFLPQEMNITDNFMERTFVVAELILLLFLAYFALKKNITNWLERTVESSVENSKKDYLYIQNYDPKKELLSSIKWAVIPLVLTIILFLITRSYTVLAVGSILTVVLLNQHQINYHLKKKRLTKEMERDFPKWMFHVILLLETESVQGAMLKSRHTVPNVLNYPLEELYEELENNPIGSDAYFDFLKDYDVPKIHEAMKLLYSISSGTGGEIEEQMMTVIEKNNDMTIRSEKIKNQNHVAGMMIYMFLPVFPIGIKMMADLFIMVEVLYLNVGTMF